MAINQGDVVMVKLLSLIVLMLFVASMDGCDIFEPDASITIIRWEQDYYEFLGGWSDLVEVWYKITNTGNVDIDYYKIWFKASCSDGSTYEDWTNGLGLDVGHSISDSMFISVPGKRVKHVMVTDYDLNTW